MERILAEPALARDLSDGGRAAVVRFSLPFVAKRMEALYLRLLQ
jgi:hypothetical protein